MTALWFKRLNKAATANDRKWHIFDNQIQSKHNKNVLFLFALCVLGGENSFALNLSTSFSILYTHAKRAYKITRYKIWGIIFWRGKDKSDGV